MKKQDTVASLTTNKNAAVVVLQKTLNVCQKDNMAFFKLALQPVGKRSPFSHRPGAVD